MVRWFRRFRANTEREGREPRRGTRHQKRARGGHGVMVDVEKSARRDLVSRGGSGGVRGGHWFDVWGRWWPSGACSGHGSLSVVHRKCEKSKISVVTVEKKVNFIIDLNFSFLFCKSALETSHISKGEEDSMHRTTDLDFRPQNTPPRYLKVSGLGSEIRDSGTLGVRETSPRHFWVPCPLNQI